MHGAELPLSLPAARRSSPLRPSASTVLALLCAAVLVLAAPTRAAELRGKVVGVADGDTITVLDAARTAHKVRLAGIDAPESGQPSGPRAKQNLSALAFGKRVIVVWRKRDRYGRPIGQVRLLGAGACGGPQLACLEDVGLAQIESGLAWHYKRFQNEQSVEDRGRYARAEHEARARREGLWKDADPVPPWEYRSKRRAERIHDGRVVSRHR